MKEEHYKELFAGKLKGELTLPENELLERHLDKCSACRQEFTEMQLLWRDMELISAPEPSPLLREDFERMLGEYVKSAGQKEWLKAKIIRLIEWRPQLSLAGQFLIALVAFTAGYWVFNGDKSDEKEQLAQLSQQVSDLKQTMMLTMLENPSASERLRAVSFTSDIRHADKEVIQALLTTLNNDPNVNVRLSTLEALTQLANKPEVRQGLVQSITRQEEPLMQLAIAETMLKLQEPSSVKPLRQLLQQEGLDKEVRHKITETINSII